MQFNCKIWSNYSIDGFGVDAKYVSPPRRALAAMTPADEKFVANHVVQSTYSCQVVKCCDPQCCEPFRSNYISIFPKRFLPKPSPIVYSSAGPAIAMPPDLINCNYSTLFHSRVLGESTVNISNFKTVPFDFFCPSAQGKLGDRACQYCTYHAPTPAALKRHLTIHNNRTLEPLDAPTFVDSDAAIPIISDLTQWLLGAFDDY